MNGLPKVLIYLGNGNLNQTTQTLDGVSGLVITGVSVAGANNVATGEAYNLKSLANAESIGITETGTNAFAWKQIRDFYAQAKTGAELWVMLVPAVVTMEEMADISNPYADKLIKASKGAIRLMAFSRKTTGTPTIADGLDEDVKLCVPKVQALGDAYFERYRPIRFIIDGKDFTGTESELKDWKTDNKNRVSILIGNNDGSKNASVGLLLGRLANNPVQRNPGRVKDGQVEEFNAYFTNGQKVEEIEESWDSIHDKRYIFLKNHIGKAGYYFTHARTLTADTDDYLQLPRGRVIDKATILTYEVFITEILDEIPLEASGQIHPALIKSWEGFIENTINEQMTAKGEISGCRANLNPNQDILGTGIVEIELKILPVGYAEYIKVNLGFTTILED